MKCGIANLSIIPVRHDKSERSEMVTQILFGEHFEIIQEEGNWLKVCLAFDNYEGWIDKKLCKVIPESTFQSLQNKQQVVSTEIINNIFFSQSQTPIRITGGSILPFLDKKSNLFNIDDEKYRFDGIITKYNKKDSRENVIAIAMNFLNAPYLWGGKTPFGIDCSGLVQIVFKITGIALPRDADYQVNCGAKVIAIDNALKGDLAFFENEQGKIIHVGIISENNTIIHCSGKVRIDALDHNGVFNKELNTYTHKLNSIRKVIS